MALSTEPKTVNPANLNINRANVIWVGIENVLPNPLNPRKNDSIKSEEMQSIIKRRGFEEPLVAYQRGKNYVLLAGHRRLYAAKETKQVKQLPIFVVEQPKSHQEEIERLASLQSGRVQWSSWEWCRFTFERWIAWGRPSLLVFSKDIALPRNTVKTYITVMDYFPSAEIEAGINTGVYSVRTLFDAICWLNEVKKVHAEVIEDLSEELVRRSMLNKIETKKIASDILRKRGYFEKISTEMMREFFVTPKMTLEELMIKCDFDITERSFHGRLVSVGLAKRNVKNIAPKNEMEAKKAFEALKELQASISNQLKDIEHKYPKTVKKDELFEW
jgi:polyhydroxyalkanoate synthesis regulator phasin